MKHLLSICLLFTALLLYSCGPKISTSVKQKYPPLDYREEVVILSVPEPTPEDAELLGRVKIGDGGLSTDCSYETVIDKAKMEARKIGGNAIKITEHKQPGLGSSCHRIMANILRIADAEKYTTPAREEIIADVDYALLHVYRFSGLGSLVGFDLKLGDSTICRVRNNYKTILHINPAGTYTLRAKTEATAEVPVTFEPGRSYYLRCGITMGAFVGRPSLELVDYQTGKTEFESFNAKHQ